MEKESAKRMGAKVRVLSREDSVKAKMLAAEARREVMAELVQKLRDREWAVKERSHIPRIHLKALFGHGKNYAGSRITAEGESIDIYYRPYLKPFKGYTPKQYFKEQLEAMIEKRKREKRMLGRADIVTPDEVKKIKEKMIEETADKMLGIIMVVGARILEVSRKGFDTIRKIAQEQQREDAKRFVFSDYETREKKGIEPGPAKEEMQVKHKGKWMSLHIFMAQIAAKYKEIEKDLSLWRGYWKFLKEHKDYPSSWRKISRFTKLPMDYELNKVLTPLEMEILKDADEIMSRNYIAQAKQRYGKAYIEAEVKKVFEKKLTRSKIYPTEEAIEMFLKQSLSRN